jgi:hypothetical protein
MTATSFIKSGATANEILLGNGTTKNVNSFTSAIS